MINVTFDQYQRYNNVRLVVESLRPAGRPLRILEVGANEHRNLEKFLPGDDILYLDIELPEHLRSDPRYILGDATAMDYEDGAFDVIVALDVFEHIPSDRREAFLAELYRVSARFAVITAPFQHREVEEAEIRTNAVYRALYHADFRWLAEHRENGLPKLDELETFLNKREWSCQIWRHGNLELWERLQAIHLVAAGNPALWEYRTEIDRYYNRYLFDFDYIGTDEQPAYRHVVTLVKEGGQLGRLPAGARTSMRDDLLEGLERLEERFYRLTGLAKPQESGHSDTVQLFYDTGDGFNEQESRVFRQPADWKQAAVTADLGMVTKPVSAIRIDPSQNAGTYTVQNLAIRSAGDATRAEEMVETGTPQSNGRLALSEHTYYFDQEDPFLVYRLKSPSSLGTITFEVSRLQERETLELLLNERDEARRNAEHLRNSRVPLEESLRLQQEELLLKINELQETRQELLNITGSRSWRWLTKLKRWAGK